MRECEREKTSREAENRERETMQIRSMQMHKAESVGEGVVTSTPWASQHVCSQRPSAAGNVAAPDATVPQIRPKFHR